MAKLVDPDSLAQATEVVVNTGAKTIQLIATGNLSNADPGSTSGVTLQCVYSFLKEEWKTDTALNKFKFPIKMFTKTDGTLQNSWTWADATTRTLVRDAGWTETDGDQYSGIISLGNFDETTDQAYYQQVTGYASSTTNFDKTGNLNESIKIYDGTGTPNYTGYLKTFLRIEQKLYSSYNLISEQGLSLLEPVLYRLPLSNSTDLKAILADTSITGSPYTGMKINYLKGTGFTTAAATTYVIGNVVKDGTGRWAFCTTGGTVSSPSGAYASFGGTSVWEAYDGEQQIGSTYYAFNRIITGNSATAQQIYMWAQMKLRDATDINADDTTHVSTQGGYGTVYGTVASDLLEYVGDTLKTKGGVLIRSFNLNDRNSMVFRDITVDGGGLNSEDIPVVTTERTYPFVSAGTIGFSTNLVAESDADTKYAMYFTYITRKTGTDISIASASGSTAVLTSTSTSLAYVLTGDYLKITGFTAAVDNGVWQATGNGTATTVAVTKLDGATVTNESAGATVIIDENPFDSAGAIIVKDNNTTDITGTITSASITFDFDYTNNIQGGRTGGTEAPVTVVAQGLPLSEWVSVESTITQGTGINISVTANDERNYANPA